MPALWVSPSIGQAQETAPSARDRLSKGADGSALSRIAVIYPDSGEPFRSFFAKIVEGIRDETKSAVPSFSVSANSPSADLANELRRQDTRVVIALGRQGLKTARALGTDLPIVAGGVLTLPDSETQGVGMYSLAPDPALLFDQLQRIAPRVKRVHVVYDPRQNAWLIRLAQDAAKARGLELVAREAQDLKGALRLYQEILTAADPKNEALWLPQDSTTVEESTILPVVLQEAWTRKLPIFSSNDAHVERGVLFSLAADNLELGRALARSALQRPAAQKPGRFPLREVRLAVNSNTAGHLGLKPETKETAGAQDAYLARILAYVQSRKKYPTSREASQQKPSGTTRAWVVLDRAGAVLEAGIERSSNSMLLDSEALKLLRLGAYPPFPAEAFLGKTSHRFYFDLEYSLSASN